MNRQSKKLCVGWETCQHCLKNKSPKVKKYTKTRLNRLTRNGYKSALKSTLTGLSSF